MPSVSPIRKSVVEFCGGRSGAVLCMLALRYLFHNQVIQGPWEKRGSLAKRSQGKQHPQGRARLQLEQGKGGTIQRQLVDIGVIKDGLGFAKGSMGKSLGK